MKPQWNCTCEATYRGTVEYCPMHAAAPAMYKALKKVFSRQIIKNGRVVERGMPSWAEVMEIRKALAKAGGER